MAPTPPSGAVRAGYALVTVLLVLTAAFCVLLTVSVVVGLARDGDSLLYGDTLTVLYQLSPESIGPMPPELRLRGWVDVNVEVHDPTTEQMLLRTATDIGPSALFLAGLWLLRGFMRSVMKGDPFGSANVARLRRLGFILVAGGPIVALVNYLLRLSLFDAMPVVPSVELGVEGFSLPAGALLGGLAVFILAEVFAFGVRLREDAEGTI